MKCDLCNKPAVVHELTMKDKIAKEVHLCEHHAQQAGIAVPASSPVKQILSQIVLTHVHGATPSTTAAPAAKKVCPGCSLNFAQFRQAGILGCPQCYQTFEDQLAPLVEGAQNGASHHAGKTPKRAGGSIDRQLLIGHLVRELDEAVAAEQYERAAQLRDRLVRLDVPHPRSGDAHHRRSPGAQA